MMNQNSDGSLLLKYFLLWYEFVLERRNDREAKLQSQGDFWRSSPRRVEEAISCPPSTPHHKVFSELSPPSTARSSRAQTSCSQSSQRNLCDQLLIQRYFHRWRDASVVKSSRSSVPDTRAIDEFVRQLQEQVEGIRSAADQGDDGAGVAVPRLRRFSSPVKTGRYPEFGSAETLHASRSEEHSLGGRYQTASVTSPQRGPRRPTVVSRLVPPPRSEHQPVHRTSELSTHQSSWRGPELYTGALDLGSRGAALSPVHFSKPSTPRTAVQDLPAQLQPPRSSRSVNPDSDSSGALPQAAEYDQPAPALSQPTDRPAGTSPHQAVLPESPESVPARSPSHAGQQDGRTTPRRRGPAPAPGAAPAPAGDGDLSDAVDLCAEIMASHAIRSSRSPARSDGGDAAAELRRAPQLLSFLRNSVSNRRGPATVAPPCCQPELQRRAEARRQRHLETERLKQQRAEERQRSEQAVVEERQRSLVEQRRRELERVRERRRQQELLRQRRLRAEQLRQQREVRADAGHRRLLVRRVFRALLLNVQRCRQQEAEASALARRQLLRRALQRWRHHRQLAERERAAAALHQRRTRLALGAVQRWRRYVQQQRLKEQAATDLSQLQRLQSAMRIWQAHLVLARVRRSRQWQRAGQCDVRLTCAGALRRWRRLPEAMQEERAAEARRDRLRRIVREMLPDFQPPPAQSV